MAKAQFHQPGANGRVFTALTAAIIIEFAAVALAGLREAGKIPVAAPFSPTPPIEAAFIAIPPESPRSEETPPLPPPPSDPAPDFVLVEPTPPPPKNVKPVARRAAMHTTLGTIPRTVTSPEAIVGLTTGPRPASPYEARRAHQTGSGMFVLTFDANGPVTDVTVTRSTGSALLDQASTSTLRRWRCRPGACAKLSVPITFTLAGAQF